MQTIYMKHFLLIMTVIFIFSACKKSSSPTNNSCPLTTANFVASYKLSTVTYKLTSSSAAVDLLNGGIYKSPTTGDTLSLDACVKSEVWTYLSNGNYSLLACGGTTVPGTWALSGQTLTLTQTVSGITFSVPSQITSFTCGKYTVIQSNFDTSGDQLTITYVTAS